MTATSYAVSSIIDRASAEECCPLIWICNLISGDLRRSNAKGNSMRIQSRANQENSPRCVSSPHLRASFVFASCMLVAACDVADPEPRDVEYGPELEGDESTSATAVEQDAARPITESPAAPIRGVVTPGDGVPQPEPGSDALVSEPDPVAGGTPICGGFDTSIRVESCTWERSANLTSGTGAEVMCSNNRFAVSGSCWATSSSHKLYRSYAVTGSFDMVNDGVAMDGDSEGWACEWDTSATGTNLHVAGALCCSHYAFATCVF